MPQRNELIVKMVMQNMKKFLRPMMLATHPPIGSTTAFETRYAVSTQVLSSWLAPRLPAMWGRATLAMEVSSTSMNAARATVAAMSHGLTLGFQPANSPTFGFWTVVACAVPPGAGGSVCNSGKKLSPDKVCCFCSVAGEGTAIPADMTGTTLSQPLTYRCTSDLQGFMDSLNASYCETSAVRLHKLPPVHAKQLP